MNGNDRPAAIAALDWLCRRGVAEFVVCAGARNAPLVVALAAAENVRVWSHFEERSAGFFALGRVWATGRPVAVVTTSGTAAAELLPAMVEAHYQGLPLVALTADRPADCRGSGAPQAIEQANLFGEYAQAFDAAGGDGEFPPGEPDFRRPIHGNVCLEEPDAASLRAARDAAAGLSPADPPPRAIPPAPALSLDGFSEPLVLIGDLLTHEIAAVEDFAAKLSAPVFAEAASGLRESPRLEPLAVRNGDRGLAAVPHRSVIRIGGVPTCRFWRDLERRPDVPVVSFSRSGHRGLGRACDVLPLEPEWLAEWTRGLTKSAPRPRRPAATDALDRLLAAFPLSEPAMVRAVASAIPSGAAILTGNSQPVREWNLCAPRDIRRPVRALRGANGIDGNLSAFFGFAADAAEGWAVVGDLTALYDLAAPWVAASLPCPRLRLVVVHNGGGRIFSQLPAHRDLADRERRLMENPHNVPLAGWARMWKFDHLAVNGPLPDSLPDRVVVELRPDPRQTADFHTAWKNTPL